MLKVQPFLKVLRAKLVEVKGLIPNELNLVKRSKPSDIELAMNAKSITTS